MCIVMPHHLHTLHRYGLLLQILHSIIYVSLGVGIMGDQDAFEGRLMWSEGASY